MIQRNAKCLHQVSSNCTYVVMIRVNDIHFESYIRETIRGKMMTIINYLSTFFFCSKEKTKMQKILVLIVSVLVILLGLAAATEALP